MDKKNTKWLIYIIAICIITLAVIVFYSTSPDEFDFASPPYYYSINFGNYDQGAFYTMLLSFSSSESYLFSCLNSTFNFDCNHTPTCVPSSTRSNVDLPFFNGSGFPATLSLNSTNFSYDPWNVTILDICSEVINSSPYTASSGIIGLGADSQLFEAFPDRKFSIYVDPDQPSDQDLIDYPNARLIFGESSQWKSGSKSFTVNVTHNWEFNVSYMSFGTNYIPIDGFAIFDVNLNRIGVPTDAYNSILDSLNNDYGMVCQSLNVCQYNGNVNSLPTIYLGDQGMPLVPAIYLQSYSIAGYYTFTLFPTSTTGNWQISVTEQYSNAIVLGFPFLQYYYTVFDHSGSAPEVRLYIAKPTEGSLY